MRIGRIESKDSSKMVEGVRRKNKFTNLESERKQMKVENFEDFTQNVPKSRSTFVGWGTTRCDDCEWDMGDLVVGS